MAFFRISKATDADYSKLAKLSFLLGRAQLSIAWSRLNHPEFLDENVADENGFGENSGEHTLRRAIN